MIIQFSAEIEDVKARKDRTLDIKISTQELSAEETALIFSFFQKQIWVGMAETTIEKLEVPESMPELKGEKSPAKRLKDRLWVYYKQKHKGNEGDFNKWYENTLDKIGQNYLEKLN